MRKVHDQVSGGWGANHTPRMQHRSDTWGTPDALAVLWRVQAEFLEAALQAADAEHGGIEPYLRHGLGLTAAAMDQLAAKYLAGP